MAFTTGFIEEGTRATAQEIGLNLKDRFRKYVWQSCPICETQRWVRFINLAENKLRNKLCSFCNRKQLGENSSGWKGGRHVSSMGYVHIYKPEHPKADRAKYVLEHVLIWEAFHQRTLPEGWVIHHINGIRDDNRPKNLLAMPKKNHNMHLVNQTLQKRIRELEIENKLLEKALDAHQMIFRIEEN